MNIYLLYHPTAVTVGTRRALERAREKVKKTRFFFQGDCTDVNHKSSRLTHDKLKRPTF